MPLSRPTSDSRTLVTAAIKALRAIHKPGFRYAKAGVVLFDLQSEQASPASLDLFDDEPEDESSVPTRGLMATLDAINVRFGRDSVGIASASARNARSNHASRQERRSPRYTTRLDEVVVARA